MEEAFKIAIIYFDEIDAIAPSRTATSGPTSMRMVATLLSAMDGFVDRGNVFVIASTNRVDSVDPALRRPGRFDIDIHIGAPDLDGRVEILTRYQKQMKSANSITKEEIKSIAADTDHFVGADLKALMANAALNTIRRTVKGNCIWNAYIDVSKMKLEKRDIDLALTTFVSSATRAAGQIGSGRWSVGAKSPIPNWDSGFTAIDDLKKQLGAMIKHATDGETVANKALKRIGVPPVRGVLLNGPAGSGKTAIVHSFAHYHKLQVELVSAFAPDLISGKHGYSEELISGLFETCSLSSKGCIILLEDIDVIGRPIDDLNASPLNALIINKLRSEMSAIGPDANVIVIATSRYGTAIDQSLLNEFVTMTMPTAAAPHSDRGAEADGRATPAEME